MSSTLPYPFPSAVHSCHAATRVQTTTGCCLQRLKLRAAKAGHTRTHKLKRHDPSARESQHGVMQCVVRSPGQPYLTLCITHGNVQFCRCKMFEIRTSNAAPLWRNWAGKPSGISPASTAQGSILRRSTETILHHPQGHQHKACTLAVAPCAP